MSQQPEKKAHPAAAIWRPLAGRWAGTNRLWLTRDEPERKSEAGAGVALSEDGRQLEIDYDWIHRERRQTAVMTTLLRADGRAETRWSDTFHTSGVPMKLKGKLENNGVVSVRGTYPVSKKEEWGWRILLDPTGARSFKLAMYNVTPEGKEELAVEVVFRRTQK